MRSYRFEQGFTYELHVAGVADEQRAAFVEKREADTADESEPAACMADKRMTLDELVGELRSGMTIGDRRMGVAAQAHGRGPGHPALGTSPTSPSSPTAAPTSACCARPARWRKVVFPFVTLDSIATDPHFRAARQAGPIETMEIDEGMFYLGLSAASQRLPFLPTRAGLGSDVLGMNPALRTVVSPYDDGEELVAVPALRLDAAIVHVNRADARGSGQILGPDPFFDELFLGAADRRYVTAERIVGTERVRRRRGRSRPCASAGC